jgi:hypothetical protein
MKQFSIFLGAIFLIAPSCAVIAAAEPDFSKSIGPILAKRCLGCHNASEAKGELILLHREGLLKGGESGAVIDAKKPEESLLLKKVVAGEMPPEEKGKSQALPKEEVEQIRAWIMAGAKWPEGMVLNPFAATTSNRAGLDWWSLQPVKRPVVPVASVVPGPGGKPPGENQIDELIHARLRAKNLEPAPPASPATLLRRLYYDITGLPPSAGEIQAFESDKTADAYERQVDRLLASPRFGERWGRYWLDLVRYADTNGYERDAPKPGAWKYRDYVIGAINRDKPYDQFVREQLAGDELPERSEETVIATGLLRIGTWDDEPNDALEYKYERLEDLVHVTGSAFLGLTVKCARCHDHKFDPIPQTDYYRLASAFWAGFIEARGRELMGGPSKEELGFDVLGWTDRADIPPLMLLKKGDPHRPVDEVKPATLSFVSSLVTPIIAASGSKTSHRRLAFANWLTNPQHPLTSRIAVNRLWQNHFGEALVRSPNNFGFKGELPTHPELLDYLASELKDGNWEMKRLHRKLVCSATYRQASIHPKELEYREKDPANTLWWKANRRRLDAESLRDTILATSGQLNLQAGGPGYLPHLNSEALEGLSTKDKAWQSSPPDQQARRSIYIFSKRSLLLPLLTTFDFADTTQPCGQRDINIVAPQALALLNNEFTHQASEKLAEQIAAKAGGSAKLQVQEAWSRILGRQPSDAELSAAISHLQTQQSQFEENAATKAKGAQLALASLCHVLLNTNELIYVD